MRTQYVSNTNDNNQLPTTNKKKKQCGKWPASRVTTSRHHTTPTASRGFFDSSWTWKRTPWVKLGSVLQSLRAWSRIPGPDFAEHRQPCEEVSWDVFGCACRKAGWLQEVPLIVEFAGTCREESLTTRSSTGLVLVLVALMKEYVNPIVMCSFFVFAIIFFSPWPREPEQERWASHTTTRRGFGWTCANLGEKPWHAQSPERSRRLLVVALSAWLVPPIKKTATNVILVHGWARCWASRQCFLGRHPFF